jgi:HAD superfamily hydrolase (TIGR01509 family)
MSVNAALPALPLPGPFDGVVVDMDGLLLHTEGHWLVAKQTLFGRYGVQLTEADHLAVFGAADLQSATYFAGRLGVADDGIVALRDEYLGIILELFDRGIELTPGAAEFVMRLSNAAPLALASNTRRTLVEHVLAGTPIRDRFDVLVCGDEATPKPAPDLYLLACARLGVEPSRSLAFEDSPTGVRAAKAAGLTCVGVPSDPRQPLPDADLVVASLAALL